MLWIGFSRLQYLDFVSLVTGRQIPQRVGKFFPSLATSSLWRTLHSGVDQLAGESHHNRLDTNHKVAAVHEVKVACRQTGEGSLYDRDTEAVTGQGAVAEILRSPPPLHPSSSWKLRSIKQLRWTRISIPFFLPLAIDSRTWVSLQEISRSSFSLQGPTFEIYYTDWDIVNDKLIFSGRFSRWRNAVICPCRIQKWNRQEKTA
jgi:hypothetical protein